MKITVSRFAPFGTCCAFLLAVCLVAAVAADADAPTQAGKRRVDVSSERVDYAVSGGGAVFSGNVVIAAGGLTVYAATLRVRPGDDGNYYEAFGAPLSVFCGDCGAESIRAVVGALYYDDETGGRMRGGVTICAGGDCRRGELRAAEADWRRDDNVVILRGSPVSGRWRRTDEDAALSVRAEQVEYRLADGDLLLRGGARIWRADGELGGDTISVNLRTGALEADGGEERVQATFGE